MITWIVDPDNADGTDYTSLSAAVAALPETWTDDYTLSCRSSSGTADTTAVDIDVGNKSTYSLTIVAASGHRAGTAWDAQKYRLVCSSAACLALGETAQLSELVIDGLQIEQSGDYDGVSGYNMWYLTPTVQNCLIRNTNASQYGNGVYARTQDAKVGVIANNIVDGWLRGVYPRAAGSGEHKLYNNAITNCATGIYSRAGVPKIVNNIIFDCTDDYAIYGSETLATGTGYNATKNEAIGDNRVDLSAEGRTDVFTSSTDWSLASGSPCIDGGVGPTTDTDVPTSDINAATRSGTTCDNGVAEYTDSGTTTSTTTTLPPTTSSSSSTTLPPTSSSSTTMPPTTSSSTTLPPTTSSSTTTSTTSSTTTTTTTTTTTSSSTTTLPPVLDTPSDLFSHDTDASAGHNNPDFLTVQTPHFSAVVYPSEGNNVAGVRIEISTDKNFASAGDVWDSGWRTLTTAISDPLGARIEDIVYDGLTEGGPD